MANLDKTEMKTSRVEAMFEAYATNLHFYLPEYKDTFCCPICLRLFDRQALIDREITIEHVIPSSLGGKMLTLSCKECNNRAGSQLEAHLKSKLDAEDILTGKVHAPLRSTVSAGSGAQTADVSFYDEQGKFSVHIDGKPELTDPDLQKQFIKALNSGERKIRMHYDLGYNDLSRKVAEIRIAYLLMFSYFGYGYIRHSNLDPIRSLIRKPDPASPFLDGVRKFENPPVINSIGIISSPIKLCSFIAIFVFSTAIDRYSGVFLPGCDTSTGELYGELRKKSDEGSNSVDITMTKIEYSPDYLIDSQFVGFPCQIWRGDA